MVITSAYKSLCWIATLKYKTLDWAPPSILVWPLSWTKCHAISIRNSCIAFGLSKNLQIFQVQLVTLFLSNLSTNDLDPRMAPKYLWPCTVMVTPASATGRCLSFTTRQVLLRLERKPNVAFLIVWVAMHAKELYNYGSKARLRRSWRTWQKRALEQDAQLCIWSSPGPSPLNWKTSAGRNDLWW